MGRIVDRIDQVPHSIGDRHPVVIDRGWGIIDIRRRINYWLQYHFLQKKDIARYTLQIPSLKLCNNI